MVKLWLNFFHTSSYICYHLWLVLKLDFNEVLLKQQARLYRQMECMERNLLGFAQTPCNEAAKFVSRNRRKEIRFVFFVDLNMKVFKEAPFVWFTVLYSVCQQEWIMR